MKTRKPNLLIFASTLVFLSFFDIKSPEHIYADDNPSEEKSTGIEGSINKYLREHGFNSLGLQTGVVIADEFDTGIGVGVKLPKEFFNRTIELTSSVYFWGASKDSLDVSSIGIEESLTLKRSYAKHFSSFTGFVLGYYFVKEKFDTFESNTLKTMENNNNSFEAFITVGTAYAFKSNRSVYTQIKYGLTQDSNELHILFGIIFYR